MFNVPLLSILGVHEMGHYTAARRHRVRVTPPYFIPFLPIPPLPGTMGALIRLKSPFPDRNALMDIGAAGPLAGAAVAGGGVLLLRPESARGTGANSAVEAGIIGCGGMGTSNLNICARYPDVVVTAACDVVGNKAYVVDANGALFIITIATPTTYTVDSYYVTGGRPWDVVVQGNVAYILDEFMGLIALDVHDGIAGAAGGDFRDAVRARLVPARGHHGFAAETTAATVLFAAAQMGMKLREGAAIGIPRFPHSCSVATTNVSERLLNTVQAALAAHWKKLGGK